ncbi:MAG TPA: hypothetical protein DEA97_19295 [Bacteroidales bacterium]|nr:hypothetical protein [Bacteroidales bacterium]
MRRIYLFLSFLIGFGCLFSQPVEKQKGFDCIKASSLMKTVEMLCLPELEGRLPGGDGYNKACDSMSQRFRSLGLMPFNKDVYYQEFTIEHNTILSPCYMKLFPGKKNEEKWSLGKDFICRGFTGGGNPKSEVVFCGYGITDKTSGYDDYKDVNVKGKIVLIIKKNPDWKLNDAGWGDLSIRKKAQIASEHGATGMILVSHPSDWQTVPIGSVMEGTGEQLTGFPQTHITIENANKILSASSNSIADLCKKIDTEKKPFSLRTGANIEISIQTNYQKTTTTKNVIGIMEGSDPELKKEYVIISGHLDHVGSQGGGEIYFPGANDDASGSAAVLEIARAFSSTGRRPLRSLVFILFACEEHGLDGATYCANNFPFPLENVKAMLNFDCIAFGDSIKVGGGGAAPELWNMTRTNDSLFVKKMVEETWESGGADATPFAEKGVKTLYFVTTNSYGHLHQITDKPETLNQNLFEKVVKLGFLSAFDVANKK